MRQPAEGPFRRAAEDRLAVFLRGLVVGALVGAILAGAALARRTRRLMRRPRGVVACAPRSRTQKVRSLRVLGSALR